MTTIYDINSLKQQNVPSESLTDWMKCNTNPNFKDTYWLMRTFIESYGVRVFWAYKDQQMQQRNGKTLTSAEKIRYIDNMMADESNYL